jgi:hypothetical protein
MHGSWRGMHRGDQGDLLRLARFRIVYHVAKPVRVPLRAIAGIEIIGRFQLLCRAGSLLQLLPADRAGSGRPARGRGFWPAFILLRPDCS